MGCVFCKIIKGELPCVKVYEDDKALAFLDIQPINPGHTLIVPKEHFENLLDTPEEALAEMMKVVKKIAPAVLKGTGCSAFNLGVNTRPEAGQIVMHTHFHIIPRYQGDGYKLWGAKAYGPGEMEDVGGRIHQEYANLQR